MFYLPVEEGSYQSPGSETIRLKQNEEELREVESQDPVSEAGWQ